MKESDLYAPIKTFLEAQGYRVKAEVKDCDVVGVRDAESAVIVELKLSLSLALVLQAIERLSLTDKVYVGIPSAATALKKNAKRTLKLFRMLGLGLITVTTKGQVRVWLDPMPYQPRKSAPRQERLLLEFEQRVGDPNTGGSQNRGGRMTAYRQRATANCYASSKQRAQ